MRVMLCSDLHLDHGWDGPPLHIAKHRPDALILAGDVHAGTHVVDWIEQSFLSRWPDLHVLYVLGNHEFYGNC